MTREERIRAIFYVTGTGLYSKVNDLNHSTTHVLAFKRGRRGHDISKYNTLVKIKNIYGISFVF